jgi:hypothetical protein
VKPQTMGIYLETLILEVGIGYEINKAVAGILLFIVTFSNYSDLS